MERDTEAAMKKASEYRQHAQECRTLAGRVEGQHRDQLLEMAATWQKLAEERSELVLRHPNLGAEGEHDEEVGQSRPEALPDPGVAQGATAGAGTGGRVGSS